MTPPSWAVAQESNSAFQSSDVATSLPADEALDAKPVSQLEKFRKILREKAESAGIPFALADAVAEVESAYNSEAIGSVGEIGLMQVLPSTAKMLGFSGSLKQLSDPETNIHYGVVYLAQAWRLASQDICTTVMKYRAGHGESRFSYRSVDYCIKVRRGLIARGFPVSGEVPKATFGEPLNIGVQIAGKRSIKSRMNWAAADARWRKVTTKITAASLIIMQ